MQPTPRYRPRWASIVAPLGVAGLLVAGLWGNLLHGYQRDRGQTRHEAEVTATNLARAFDEHVVRTVQHIDTLLLHLRLEYQRAPDRFHDRRDDVFWNTYGGEFMQVGIIDRDGMLLYSNLSRTSHPVDLSDREHFRVHQDSGEDKLFISKPVFGRVSQKWSIQFTRRRMAPDGTFDGVLVISVDPAYFSDFYETIDIGAKGAITLLGTDGIIRARAARIVPSADPVGSSLPKERPFFDPKQPDAAGYGATSAVDGMVRIGAYRRLRAFPLIVLVLLAEEDVFAGAEERHSVMVSIGGLVSALLFGSAMGIAWLLDRERRYRNELEQANSELRYLADTDVLTGAKNRRAFTALAEVEIARHHRHERPLSIIMMDLDHFKEVNDGHGHAAGDAVLSEVVRRCRGSLRCHDVIGRLGGEEFAILLPETGLAQAHDIAERLRRAIAAGLILIPEGESLQVTASMGITALCAGDHLDALLHRADQALYQAKDRGRNRSVAAGGDVAPAGWCTPDGWYRL